MNISRNLTMFSCNDCHLCILPNKENECIKLIRYNNQIYKFAIKSSDILQKFLTKYGVINVQMELQDILLQVLSMNRKKSGEMKIDANLFSAKITLSESIVSEITAEPGVGYSTALTTEPIISTESLLSAENPCRDTFPKLENEADYSMNTENTAMKGKNLKQMEKERLKKLFETTIPDIPKKQNRKNKRKGILNYIFRFLYNDTD